jgi:hypothetical protein
MSNARDFASRVPVDGALSNRNMVTNGAMTIAQRSTSVSGVRQNGYYACDRAQVYFSSIDEMDATVSQDSSGPDGFTKSHKVLVTTAETSIDSNDLHCMLWYKIEGQDLQQLSYGNSNAKPMTLSFWVKSNVTGTYTVSFYGSIGGTLSVVAPTYTITAANTWEYKTITISGSTVGALVDSNGTGLELYWNGLVGPQFTSGSAANSWTTYATNNWAVGHTADFGLDVNDYWQITGVQLEVGDTATPFEHRSYGDELARCQRYYEQELSYDGNSLFWSGTTTSGLNYWDSCGFAVPKRVPPTVSIIGENPYNFGPLSATVHPSYGTNGFRVTAVANVSAANSYFRCQWTADAEL